jgi:hypothetical protein
MLFIMVVVGAVIQTAFECTPSAAEDASEE